MEKEKTKKIDNTIAPASGAFFGGKRSHLKFRSNFCEHLGCLVLPKQGNSKIAHENAFGAFQGFFLWRKNEQHPREHSQESTPISKGLSHGDS